jgi:hypothetical protein
MLPLPIKFDANEWFILLNSVFGYTWVLFLPKRYPKAISILVVLFCVLVATIFDHIIGIPPLDMYDINDQKNYELMDIFTYFMYSPYALLFVYLYDKFDPKGLYITPYIVGWSILSVIFEWLAVKCHVFTYNNWSLIYSFSVYLVSTTLELNFFRFIYRYFSETRKKHYFLNDE